MDTYLKISEAAKLLNVDHKVVRREIESGRLPAVRIGRIYRVRRSDIQRLTARNEG